MMETGQAKCRFCGAVLEPGAHFCEVCGTPVDAVALSAAVPSASVSVSLPSASIGGSALPQSASPFKLSAALPAAMQVGRRSLVHVRFRAAADIYESVEFVLRNGSVELGRRLCCYGRPQTREHEAVLDITPQRCGAARIELDVVCRIGTGNDVEIYTAALQIAVDDRQTSAFSPTFNINQVQTADRAGDNKGGNINVDFGGLKFHQEIDLSRYETPRSFSSVETELRTSPSRLTLQGESEILQLLSDGMVSFGRKREDNIIPLRIYGADGKIDRALNECNISRRHFRIEREGNDCLIRDGGIAPDATVPSAAIPSAYGTRIDGMQLPPAGTVRLVSDNSVLLGIGREEVELKMRLRFFRDRWSRPAGLLVEREDGARQRICVVWREVPLPSGENIFWNGCRWTLVNAALTLTRPLAVGTSVSIGGRQYEVLPFHQTHVN